MPLRNFKGKMVVLPNYDFKDSYWPIVTELVQAEIKDQEETNPKVVQRLLKQCFSTSCEILLEKISEQKRASFFIFCHSVHEDSIDIWSQMLQGYSLGEYNEDFAASRRILKIIIEQSTRFSLTGTNSFIDEINENIESYVATLKELLYIGTYCYLFSEYTTRSLLFNDAIGLKIEEGELSVLTYQPYPELFKHVHNEFHFQSTEVVLSNSIEDFIKLLESEFGVEYNKLSAFVASQLENPVYRYGVAKLEDIKKLTNDVYGYSKGFLDVFFDGLKVSKDNVLEIHDCFLRNQDENRFSFRPIVELLIDKQVYHMIGYFKWIESFTMMATNCFPFGHYPSEWKSYGSIKAFVNRIEDTHDELLENPIKEILEKNSMLFDSNIESLKQAGKNNINIGLTIGDIDILFVDEARKTVYTCECKHNRARFDLNNWKRDYSNFKNTYESQLLRKVNWTKGNLKIIQDHLVIISDSKFQTDITEYDVEGIFIINSPTIYMFNGNYKAYTIQAFKDLIENKSDLTIFKFSNHEGKEFVIEHPYFDNISKTFFKK